MKLIPRENDRRRRERRHIDNAADQRLKLRRNISSHNHRDILLRIDAAPSDYPRRGRVLRTAEGRRAQNSALQLRNGGDFLSRDQPEQVSLEAYGEDFEWDLAPFQSADDGSDPIGCLNLTTQRRRDRHITADLHNIDIETLITKEVSLLADVKIDGRDAAAGNGKNDFLLPRLGTSFVRRSTGKNKN